MNEIVEVVQGTEIVREAAESAVNVAAVLMKLGEKLIEEHPKAVGLGICVIAVGAAYGIATGLPEFFKNSYVRWSSGEVSKTA